MVSHLGKSRSIDCLNIGMDGVRSAWMLHTHAGNIWIITVFESASRNQLLRILFALILTITPTTSRCLCRWQRLGGSESRKVLFANMWTAFKTRASLTNFCNWCVTHSSSTKPQIWLTCHSTLIRLLKIGLHITALQTTRDLDYRLRYHMDFKDALSAIESIKSTSVNDGGDEPKHSRLVM